MDRDSVCEQFLDIVPFELYPFQEEALLTWFDCDDGMLVTAPTGMGKTLIAESAIFEALATETVLYYTTPLIALTDQKFREFQDKAEDWGFDREDVGLITGNRKINPDALVKIVVAEILLNHLLSDDVTMDDVSGVVMDEFHWFHEPERGIVWELSLVLLPKHVRLMLLSATVGNPMEFIGWLRENHGRSLRLARTDERRVPLEFHWVEDKLLAEHLPEMATDDDATCRTPALVFSFIRDACWEVAERLKGLPLVSKETRERIEAMLEGEDLTKGIGVKLKQMLIRGVGVHHAGILPRYKEIVEALFLEKLVPFVVCTETLAAGINLPARSVVLSTLLKGKHGAKKIIPASSAHQMFGRAGRPQFDERGFVFVMAPEDDVKINKWKVKWEQLDTGSKEAGILRAKKQLEKKRPKRRNTEQYWTEGQFQNLVKAGSANLRSGGMIPYPVLIFLLSHLPDLSAVRTFVQKRLDTPKRLEGYQRQLDHMLKNLEGFGYVKLVGDHGVEVDDSIEQLRAFRSIDPLFGVWLAKTLGPASIDEKIMALESLLNVAPAVARAGAIPWDMEKGPLQENVLEPLMLKMGVKLAPDPSEVEEDGRKEFDPWAEEEEKPPSYPEMLKLAFEAKLVEPDQVDVQPKWLAGGVFDSQDDFHSFVGSRSLQKNEGIVFRHLLRLVILAGEFYRRTDDPEYDEIAARVTDICRDVDPGYTEKYLASEEESSGLLT